jgi:hypothetical protein
MTGCRHQHLDGHILVYIGCQFEAYLCRNNWQQNLNTSTEWADRLKYNKMTGHRHILAYIWCKFEAYLCRNNWQQNLNTSTEWKDRLKYKKMTGHQHRPMDQQLDRHILVYIWCKFEAYLCRNNWQHNLNTFMMAPDMQK